MCNSTLSLTSSLDEVGGQRHAPAALPLGLTWYPMSNMLGVPQGRSRRLQKISQPPPPTGIRSPDRPARGLSLCRLSCPGPTTKGEQLIILPDGATNWCQQVSITGSFQGTRLYQYRVKWSCSCVLYHRMLAHAVCIGGCDASVLNCQAVVFTFRLLCPWERLPVTISCQVGLTPQLDWKQRRRRQILSLLESSVFHLTV